MSNTRKIALVKLYDTRTFYEEELNGLVDRITDFTEVSDEDFVLLKSYASRTNNFVVIEYLPDQAAKIEFSVKSQLKFVREENEKRLAEAKLAEQKRQERLKKKLEKEAKARKDLLQTLIEENPDIANDIIEQIKKDS